MVKISDSASIGTLDFTEPKLAIRVRCVVRLDTDKMSDSESSGTFVFADPMLAIRVSCVAKPPKPYCSSI